MRLYPIKTPELVQRMYPDFLWRFPSAQQELFLTFDDGPTPDVTEFVLDMLQQYEAQATFFCIGKNIADNSELFDRIVSEGHAIGNHTHNHLKGWRTLRKVYLENTLKAQELIEQRLGTQSNRKLFRPPYGKIRKMQTRDINKQGFQIVLWDVLSADWDPNISKERCMRNIVENTTDGSIIVFHDSVKAEDKLRYVLPKVLAHFSAKGFRFRKID